VDDEIIKELVNQLNGQDIRRKRKYYDHEPLYIDYRAYNLVFDYDEEQPTKILLIIMARDIILWWDFELFQFNAGRYFRYFNSGNFETFIGSDATRK